MSDTQPKGLDVDEIAPLTPELLQLARSRSDEIVKEWGRLAHIWGTGGLWAPDGSLIEKAPTIPELAAACYAQGVRDAVAVAVTQPMKP